MPALRLLVLLALAAACAAPAAAATPQLRPVGYVTTAEGMLGSVAAAPTAGGAVVSWSSVLAPLPSEHASPQGPRRALEARVVDRRGEPRALPFTLAFDTDGPYGHGLLGAGARPVAFWEHLHTTRATGLRVAPARRGTYEAEVADVRAAPDGRAMAIARVGGGLLLAWVTRNHPDDDGRVLAQRLALDGARRGPLQDLGPLPGGGDRALDQRIAMAAAEDGSVLLARYDGRDLTVQALDPLGDTDDRRGVRVPGATASGGLRVAAAGGRFVVLWTGGRGLHAASVDRSGRPVGPARLLDAGASDVGQPVTVPGRRTALVPYRREDGLAPARVLALAPTGAPRGAAAVIPRVAQPPAVAVLRGSRRAIVAGRTRTQVLAGCLALGRRARGDGACGVVPAGTRR